MSHSRRFWAYIAIMGAVIITLLAVAFNEAEGCSDKVETHVNLGTAYVPHGTVIHKDRSTPIIIYLHHDNNRDNQIVHLPVDCVRVDEIGVFGYLNDQCVGEFYIFVPHCNLVNVEREVK